MLWDYLGVIKIMLYWLSLMSLIGNLKFQHFELNMHRYSSLYLCIIFTGLRFKSNFEYYIIGLRTNYGFGGVKVLAARSRGALHRYWDRETKTRAVSGHSSRRDLPTNVLWITAPNNSLNSVLHPRQVDFPSSLHTYT